MKTFPQKLIGSLGFWYYQEITCTIKGYESHIVVYWCFWPWKFHRKIDLFRINRTKQYHKKLQRQRALIEDFYKESTNEDY